MDLRCHPIITHHPLCGQRCTSAFALVRNSAADPAALTMASQASIVDGMNVTTSTVRYKDGDANLHADLRAVCTTLVEGWSAVPPSTLQVVVIQGGITNLLYRLDNPTPGAKWASALVRVFGAKTELLIDREKDNRVFQALSDAKFGPYLHGVFGNGRVEGWVDAKPLEPAQMGEVGAVDYPSLIAQSLATMHQLNMAGSRSPMLWPFLAKWFDMSNVTFTDERLTAGLNSLNRAKLATELEWLKTVLPSPANGNGNAFVQRSSGVTAEVERIVSTVVFCHNDLLSGNILKLTGKAALQVVDFEYGGYNFAGFDLANHFCEYAGFDFDLDRWYPNAAAQARFFEAYLRVAFPRSPWLLNAEGTAKLCAALSTRVNQLALASHFFWGLWAIIQARHSPIDFDFMGYALERFWGYYKHKKAFFPTHFTSDDEAAYGVLIAAKQRNADLNAAAAGGEEEAKGTDTPTEEPKKCPFGHGATGDAQKPSGKCPYTGNRAAIAEPASDDVKPSGGSGCPIHSPRLWLGVGIAAVAIGLFVWKRANRS